MLGTGGATSQLLLSILAATATLAIRRDRDGGTNSSRGDIRGRSGCTSRRTDSTGESVTLATHAGGSALRLRSSSGGRVRGDHVRAARAELPRWATDAALAGCSPSAACRPDGGRTFAAVNGDRRVIGRGRCRRAAAIGFALARFLLFCGLVCFGGWLHVSRIGGSARHDQGRLHGHAGQHEDGTLLRLLPSIVLDGGTLRRGLGGHFARMQSLLQRCTLGFG